MGKEKRQKEEKPGKRKKKEKGLGKKKFGDRRLYVV